MPQTGEIAAGRRVNLKDNDRQCLCNFEHACETGDDRKISARPWLLRAGLAETPDLRQALSEEAGAEGIES